MVICSAAALRVTFSLWCFAEGKQGTSSVGSFGRWEAKEGKKGREKQACSKERKKEGQKGSFLFAKHGCCSPISRRQKASPSRRGCACQGVRDEEDAVGEELSGYCVLSGDSQNSSKLGKALINKQPLECERLELASSGCFWVCFIYCCGK